jgi:hypothetical protein
LRARPGQGAHARTGGRPPPSPAPRQPRRQPAARSRLDVVLRPRSSGRRSNAGFTRAKTPVVLWHSAKKRIRARAIKNRRFFASKKTRNSL